MNEKNKVKITILILCSLVFSLGLYTVQGGTLNKQDSSYGKINIKNQEVAELWWLKNHKSDTVFNEWGTYTEKLVSILETDESLSDIYVSNYGNSYNNTWFIVLSDISPEITQSVIKQLSVPKSVNIKFRKGYASRPQLDAWINEIPFGKIEKDGVDWTCFTKTENGTIMIGVASIDENTQKIIESHIKGKIPLEVVKVRVFEKLELHDYDDRHRPILGAIGVGTYLNVNQNKASALSFVGTVDGDDYAIVSGHVVNTAFDDVWNPPNTRVNSKIGDAEVTNNTNGGIDRFSDSGLVPIDSGVSATSYVYGPSYNTIIVGQKNYSAQSQGNAVTMAGRVSGYRGGTINLKIDCCEHEVWGYINNTIKATYYSQDGDSGAPIIQSYYEDGQWKSLAWGLHVGKTGSYSYYSCVDGVEEDFDIDFDFAGT